MMLPFFNHKKQFFSNKSPYALFKVIDSLDLTDKLFAKNTSNLVSSIEQITPLVIKFRNHRSLIQRVPAKYFSTTVGATFYEDNNTSKIDMLVKTNPIFYVIYVTLTFGLIASIFDNNVLSSVLPFIFSLSITAIIDFVSKRSILKRVENLLMPV